MLKMFWDYLVIVQKTNVWVRGGRSYGYRNLHYAHQVSSSFSVFPYVTKSMRLGVSTTVHFFPQTFTLWEASNTAFWKEAAYFSPMADFTANVFVKGANFFCPGRIMLELFFRSDGWTLNLMLADWANASSFSRYPRLQDHWSRGTSLWHFPISKQETILSNHQYTSCANRYIESCIDLVLLYV